MSQVEYVFAPAGPDGSDGLLGIVIRRLREQADAGVQFFTSKDCEQQVGYIKHTAGHVIPPHYHNPAERLIRNVPETLLVRKGRLLVNFYACPVYGDRPPGPPELVKGVILEAEDVVVLLKGGHGFEVLEDCEVYEVRQGPYLSERDKTRF